MNFLPYHSATTPSTPTLQRSRTTTDNGTNRPSSNPFFSPSHAGSSTPISTGRNPYDNAFSQQTPRSAGSGSAANDPGPLITRSRTLFYLSVRDSTGSSGRSRKFKRRRTGYGDEHGASNLLGVEGEERAGLMGKEENGIGMESYNDSPGAGLPPKWVDIMDDVEEIMTRVKQKISILEKLHAKHVLPGFTDRTAEEREIENNTVDITRASRRFLPLRLPVTESDLNPTIFLQDFRKIHSLLTNIRPSSNAPDEIKAARNVQRGLAAKVQDLSSVFRRKQRVYMETLQGHANKNKDLMTASGAITLKGPALYDELQADIEASNSQLTQVQTQAHRKDMSSQIAKRDRELTQIAKSISELADLFQDLSNMVVEQGTVLDCVEYNVEQTNTYVQEAGQELKVAETYQRRTGRRKCICFLLLVIVGLVIVLIYKPRGRPSKAGTSSISADDKSGIVTEIVEPITQDLPTTTRYHRPVRPSPITTLATALPSMGQGRPPLIRPPSKPGLPIRPPIHRPRPPRPTADVGLD